MISDYIELGEILHSSKLRYEYTFVKLDLNDSSVDIDKAASMCTESDVCILIDKVNDKESYNKLTDKVLPALDEHKCKRIVSATSFLADCSTFELPMMLMRMQNVFYDLSGYNEEDAPKHLAFLKTAMMSQDCKLWAVCRMSDKNDLHRSAVTFYVDPYDEMLHYIDIYDNESFISFTDGCKLKYNGKVYNSLDEIQYIEDPEDEGFFSEKGEEMFRTIRDLKRKSAAGDAFLKNPFDKSNIIRVADAFGVSRDMMLSCLCHNDQ